MSKKSAEVLRKVRAKMNLPATEKQLKKDKPSKPKKDVNKRTIEKDSPIYN